MRVAAAEGFRGDKSYTPHSAKGIVDKVDDLPLSDRTSGRRLVVVSRIATLAPVIAFFDVFLFGGSLAPAFDLGARDKLCWDRRKRGRT